MRKVVLYVLIGVSALTGVSMAGDRGKPGDGIDLPRGKWWRMPEVANELKISADEQKKLDDHYYKHRNQVIDLKSNLEKGQLALERIIENENLDESASMNQYQEVLNAQNKLSLERYNFLIEVRKLLGYERFVQLKPKFHELQEERSQKYNGGKEPKGRGDRP
jgi:Spy/CpxP family protein refolding chaperone